MENRPYSSDPADDEALMAALGRLALRAAELGELLHGIAFNLSPEHAEKSAKSMVGARISMARKVVLCNSPSLNLKKDFMEFCAYCESLLEKRNSPIHATLIPGDI